MAAYEYNCLSCDIKVIKHRSISSSDPGYTCDACNADLVRVYSLGAVTFNGSGFYSKDK